MQTYKDNKKRHGDKMMLNADAAEQRLTQNGGVGTIESRARATGAAVDTTTGLA